MVGVCHSVRDTHAFLAWTVGVPEDEIEYLTAGFNHQAFVLRFERKATGEDLYPLLDAAIAADPDGLGRRIRVELYRQIGFFPTESSEHSAEYLPWFMGRDELIERYRIPVGDYLRRSEENLDEYAEPASAPSPRGRTSRSSRRTSWRSNIIQAIETGTPRVEYVNVHERRPDREPAGGVLRRGPRARSTRTASTRSPSARCRGPAPPSTARS